MMAIFQRSSFVWVGFALSLAVGGMCSAQTLDGPPQTSGSFSLLETYFQNQSVIGQQWQALVAQGARAQQFQLWWQQNASVFQALQQLAQEISQESALEPEPLMQDFSVPANVSGTMADFLTTQATLANAQAQIHNELLATLPSSAPQQQVAAMFQQEQQLFWQQYGADVQLQSQRAQALAAESESQPIPTFEPADIPLDASPQLHAFLAARNALASDQSQVWNEYVNADPATRRAALMQWCQQNAARMEQLSQLTQDLSDSTTNQEGTNQ